MANFNESFRITFEKEGGYCNNPNDKGGETIFGISRRYHPEWAGWNAVDMTKQFCVAEEGTKEFNEELTNHLKLNGTIQKQKLEFYKDKFWNVLKLDDVKNQKIANAIFDASVNHDPADAAKMAQNALGICADGIVGSKTIEALNSAEEFRFLRAFTVNRIRHYKSIVSRDVSQSVFLSGWIRRAESFNA